MKLSRRSVEPTSAQREIRIVNELGLHARPAAEFVRKAHGFRSEIWLIKEGQRFSATSLIEVMRANLERGAAVTLEAHGVDAEVAVDALEELVRNLRDVD
ncbi:MAG TPA: HPr family phosphocarrier protein [Chthoniobacterales bacterium]|nr:HPr family phosphocarrier protein [Chthoniobacterales bacterium]